MSKLSVEQADVKGEKMDRYKVDLQQGENIIHLAFNDFDDAKEFAVECMECADAGTKVIYWEDTEE